MNVSGCVSKGSSALLCPGEGGRGGGGGGGRRGGYNAVKDSPALPSHVVNI